jgi:hypothetical protein
MCAAGSMLVQPLGAAASGGAATGGSRGWRHGHQSWRGSGIRPSAVVCPPGPVRQWIRASAAVRPPGAAVGGSTTTRAGVVTTSTTAQTATPSSCARTRSTCNGVAFRAPQRRGHKGTRAAYRVRSVGQFIYYFFRKCSPSVARHLGNSRRVPWFDTRRVLVPKCATPSATLGEHSVECFWAFADECPLHLAPSGFPVVHLV